MGRVVRWTIGQYKLGKPRRCKTASNCRLRDGILLRRPFTTVKRYWYRSMAHVPVVSAIAVSLLGSSPASRAQCDSLKSGEKIWVRLLEPLSSYSGKAGEKIDAMVIDSPVCNGAATIIPGTIVEGKLTFARKVGMGLVHETAQLRVNFEKLKLKDGGEVALSSQLVGIDNARETVRDGLIRGVNATDTPQGRITSRLKHLPTWNPYSDFGLIAYRLAFPVFPEPEIYLPRGSDLRLELTARVAIPPGDDPYAMGGVPDEAEKAVMQITAPAFTERTTTSRGQAADIVNVALLGNDSQMARAFYAAGWAHGDKTSTRSVMKQMHAFLSFNNYANAPMSTQLMDGEKVTTTWEKGLDSYEKREHLRLWARDDVFEGQTVWIGAMTRETGATLSVRHHSFIHHIDSDMDDGRTMIIRDLNLAGCVAAVYYVARPQMAHSAMNSTGDPMRTDGSLAVVQLKDCENPVFAQTADDQTVQSRPRSKFARYVRMQVLSFRSDLIRGNIVYGAFDLTRMAIRARKQYTEKAMQVRQVATDQEQARLAAMAGTSTAQ